MSTAGRRAHPAGADNKLKPQVTKRVVSSSSSSSESSSSSSSSSDSEDTTDESESESTSMTRSPEPKTVELLLPEEVPQNQRHLLLRGKLTGVVLPDNYSYPSRFGDRFDVGHRCEVCGHRQNPNKPRTCHPEGACPILQEREVERRTWTADIWPYGHCLYPLCNKPGDHFTQVCPELHSMCLICCKRGHSKARCESVWQECSEETLAHYYRCFWRTGIRTRKRDKCHEWDFSPRLPEFRLVSSSKRHFLMPWSQKELDEFKALPSEERFQRAQAELFK